MLGFIIGVIVGSTVTLGFIILVAAGSDRHDNR